MSTEVADGAGTLHADELRFRQVLLNLLSNAVKFTPSGGSVAVRAARDGAELVVTVSDTGVGIPAERLEDIFEDFMTTKRRGLGLGLAISKKITEQLGGEISVASEVGKGTTFTIEFPRAAAPPTC